MKITRVLLLVALSAGLASWYFAAQAQDRDEQRTTGKTTTVTGCLAKGDEPNEFYLTADDGKRYEAHSESVSLADHVGHKVTVKGAAAKESEDSDKGEKDEKRDAREGAAANLQVTDLQMVSNSCK